MSAEAIAKIEPGTQQLAALRQIASQATPKEEVRWRKGRGGQEYPYTDAAYVIRTLNEAFGWDWDCEVENEQVFYVNERPFEVGCRVRLTVRLNGQAVVKMQYGCQPIDFLKDGITPVSIGDAHKGAATDGLKKCASELGIALDLYDSDSPIHRKNGNVGQGQSRGESQQSKPRFAGKAQQVVALQQALKWPDEQLVKVIEEEFKIDDVTITEEFFESLSAAELSTIIQLLKAELQQKGKTNGGK